MPHVAVYQGGNTANIGSTSSGPQAHLGLSLFVLFCVNPPFADYIASMPVVLHAASGRTTLVRVNEGPKAHLCLALFVMCCVNPPFGLIALIFACLAKAKAARDWDGAMLRGKISFGFSVTGIVITVIGILAFVLIFYTRDS